MKKRFLCVTLMLMILLCSCGSSQKASDKAITCGNKAIEAAEKYLSYDLSYDDAKEIIEQMADNMKYTGEQSKDDPNHSADVLISSDIVILSSALFTDSYRKSDESYDELNDAIQSLKDTIDKYD